MRALTLACLLFASSALATQIQSLQVEHEKKRYRVDLTVLLQAPAAAAFAVMRDYASLDQLNPSVESVALLPGAAHGEQRVQTRVRVCVAFYCRVLEQVQDMRAWREGDQHRVHADVLPELSNLRFGKADWTLWPCNEAGGDASDDMGNSMGSGSDATESEKHSCLRFTAELEPDFWVPPVIGPWILKRKLREEALQTSAGIEAAARQL